MQTYVEWLKRICGARTLKDIHAVLGVVSVLVHGDIDVELAVDVVQLGSPYTAKRSRRRVNDRAGRGPLREVRRTSNLNVVAGGVEEVVEVSMLEDPGVSAATGLDRYAVRGKSL